MGTNPMNESASWGSPDVYDTSGRVMGAPQRTCAIRPRLGRSPHVGSLVERTTLKSVWQMRVLSRVFELIELEPNWDSYGASVPTEAAGDALMDVLRSIMRPETPTPSIVPTPEGHFQAEWHTNGVDLEIEVVSPTEVVVSYSGRTPPWDDVLSHDFGKLLPAVDELTR